MPARKDLAGEKSLVGDFSWNDVLVPENAGTGLVKWHYQRRTLIQYAFLAAAGLTTFYKVESPALRAAGLGFLFPGAGLIAVCTLPSILVFIISIALLPLVLFAWFGMGGVIFPALLWIGTSGIAAALAKSSLWEASGPVWTAVCVAGVVYITYSTQKANAEARRKRIVRNAYLVEEVKNSQQTATLPEPGTRELDEENLRFLQWFIELALTPKDNFSYHDVIDQFQTSAIRYQLYEAVSDLGIYQMVYCPNFHGYASQAQRNVIEKSLTKKVVGFWKYECMAGKLNAHDWDPIKKDNIMVTGYILQALGIYMSNTRDNRYTKKDCMEFEVTDSLKFKYDMASIAEAVYRNMNENAYTLYPCEPNWLYTPCNLIGVSGLVAADRLLNLNYGDQLKERFESALEKEFTNPDGSILPIRSELTGFTIPGLAGALSDTQNSMLCAPYLPHIAHRNWAFCKRETLRWDENGRCDFAGLMGADKLDPGNYKSGEGAIRCITAAAAAEFGEEKTVNEMLRQLDTEYFPVFKTKTGALKNKGLSVLWQGVTLRARISKFQDWAKMLREGPPEHVFRAPMLERVDFPDVLVAKAYSRDGESVELVLYNGNEPGVFTLGFDNCKPNESYSLMGQVKTAGKDGKADFEVKIDGRTAGRLEPTARN